MSNNRKIILVLLGLGGLGICGCIFVSATGLIISTPTSIIKTIPNPAPVSSSTAIPIAQPIKEEPITTIPENPLIKIQSLVHDIDSSLEVTLWTKDSDFGEEGNGPWEVIVNSKLGAFDDCFSAKDEINKIMKSLYTNSVTKTSILRVLINLTSQASASLGSTDALSIDQETWNNNGPTNFAKALLASGTDEVSSKPLEEQTYWRSINGNCSP